MKKILLILIILLCVGNLSFSQDGDIPNDPSNTQEDVRFSDSIKTLRILHWNDVHARNMPYKVSKKDEETGEKTYYYLGGISNLLGYINMLKDDKTLLFDGGDSYQGSPISTITRGFSQIEVLNMLEPDAFVIGNHEFDYGQYALDSALMMAEFNYLSANVFFNPRNETFGKPFIIEDVNGIKVGVIGITALELETLVLPKNISEITMLNADSVIAVGISELKTQECDLIMLLTHVGFDNDKLFAEKFYSDVDIIVGGHSHIPLYKPFIQNGVIICQAGSYTRWLGKLDLDVDIQKDTVLSYSGELIETVMDSSIYDKAAQEKVESMLASIQGELSKVIGKLETDWTHSYSKESNLGQWEADAIREKVKTDITFMNAGGLRKNLPKGDITVGDIWEINPFGNTIVTFNVSGKTLWEMMKNNLRNTVLEIEESGYSDLIIVSGIEIEYDSRKVLEEADDFILSIKVGGTEIEDDNIYSISTNNYVGAQFKKYFGDVSEEIEIHNTNIIDRDLIIEAVKKQKVINSVVEKRIMDISEKQ
ncbi:MAG: bifunctional metallophosphatase/5'-nucleotidase [Ignavibacteria bacterium]|nr:bifunctional metallophosphatase/5'-nucleotidase [Ignavibacteria bacterium]